MAFDGLDGNGRPHPAQKRGALAAARDHKVISPDRLALCEGGYDPTSLNHQLRDGGTEPLLNPLKLKMRRERFAKRSRIASFILLVMNRSGELPSHRFKGGLDRGDFPGLKLPEAQTLKFQSRCCGECLRGGAAKHLQRARRTVR